jgi:hypothetical protein
MMEWALLVIIRLRASASSIRIQDVSNNGPYFGQPLFVWIRLRQAKDMEEAQACMY